MAGRSAKNMVPPPGASAKPTLPPICWTISFTMLRPSPVPPLARASELSAWANRSNTRPLKCAGMPGPWSRTMMRTLPSRRSAARTISLPRGENLIAFDRRLAPPGPADPCRHRRRRRRTAQIEPQDEAGSLRQRAADRDRLLEQGLDRDRLEMERDLAGLELLDVEDVVDEAMQAPAVRVGDVEQFLRLEADMRVEVVLHQGERGGDRGQRRAQLVADRGDELVLELRRLLGDLPVALGAVALGGAPVQRDRRGIDAARGLVDLANF